MSVATIVRSSRTLPFRKPLLSPKGEAARKALAEATKIVSESSIGQFLVRNDSPEGIAMLVAATQKEILR